MTPERLQQWLGWISKGLARGAVLGPNCGTFAAKSSGHELRTAQRPWGVLGFGEAKHGEVRTEHRAQQQAVLCLLECWRSSVPGVLAHADTTEPDGFCAFDLPEIQSMLGQVLFGSLRLDLCSFGPPFLLPTRLLFTHIP